MAGPDAERPFSPTGRVRVYQADAAQADIKDYGVDRSADRVQLRIYAKNAMSIT